MKSVVIACGFEPEQLEQLDQALPADYVMRVEAVFAMESIAMQFAA